MAEEPDTGVKQRLGPISENLHHLFRRYILHNIRPSMEELQEADFKFAREEGVGCLSLSHENELSSGSCMFIESMDEPLDLTKKAEVRAFLIVLFIACTMLGRRSR